MDSPENEIEGIILTLCQGSAHEQDEALHKYFLDDASFTHPLCYVPRFKGVAVPFFGFINSLWLVQCIFRWYITFAPKIDMSVESAAFDEKNSLLYATVRQSFTIWFFPIYSVSVKLVTVLKLQRQQSRLAIDASKSPELEAGDKQPVVNDAAVLKYYIASQEDLYQMNYVLEFLLPHLAVRLWTLVQLFTTGVCAILATITLPLHFYLNPDTKRQKAKQ